MSEHKNRDGEKMDRLTKRNDEGTAYYYPKCFQECGGPECAPKCGKCAFETEVCSKLGKYEDLDDQGKLARLPCVVGDFALFSSGDIRPVTHITISNMHDGIIVGCQNGIKISMNLNYGSWCKGFFKTQQEAKDKFAEMKGKK